MIEKLLIICVGNICRSPMAEALFAEKLKQTSPDVSVSSAGLGALVNHSADPFAQDLMRARGLDISFHRARQATQEIYFNADLILTMSTGQQEEIESKFPSARGRVQRLGKWGEYDIVDPYKRPKAIFEQALQLIDQGVNDWYKKLWG
ncbi:MAG: low molecular weight phosphotyrosine protein phosphatase [Legionella sp.]|nr:MAG: low molecular weight phosphotyrosine protein phosphatase [Legionella sp.]